MKDTHGSVGKGWIGVDLDGTLAIYHGWVAPDHIGPPVPEMLDRVWGWLKAGKDVRIMTARVHPSKLDAQICRKAIEEWCSKHLLQTIPITHEKDHFMLELWDDRCVQVIPNSGLRADSVFSRPLIFLAKMSLSLFPRDSDLAKSIRCQYDLHDYCDWEDPTPTHFIELPCVRCGKKFSI